MEYYIDTAVWVALVRPEHPFHKMARAIFEKTSGGILVSYSHLKEMGVLGLENEFKQAVARLGCKWVKQTEMERKAAYELNKKTKMGYGDCLHIYCAKKAKAVAISPDWHWKALGKSIGVRVLGPNELSK